MKKNLLLGALVSTVVASSAFADAPSPAFNGFYVGAGLTYSNGKINNKSSLLSNVGAGTIGGSSKGAGITGFLGYGAILGGGFYLGGELGLGYDGSRFNNKSGGTGIFSGMKFKSSSLVYSIAARLGYAFSNVLPYVKFGFEGRSGANLKRADGSAAQFGNAGTIKAARNGLMLGAGLDYALTKNVFIRGEYTHSFGSKSTYSVNNVKVLDFRTPTDTFLIGAGYRF